MLKKRLFLYGLLFLLIFISQMIIYILYLNFKSLYGSSVIQHYKQGFHSKGTTDNDKDLKFPLGRKTKLDELYEFNLVDGNFYEHINYQMNFLPVNRISKHKLILLYNGFNVSRTLGGEKPGKTTFIEHNCPVISCQLTADQSNMQKADAVIWQDSSEQSVFQRPRNQVWIMYNTESPEYSSSTFKRMFNKINWTMTYRHDSTIPTPYFMYIQHFSRKQHNILRKINHSKHKRKLVAAVISNCDTKNNRLLYIKELSKYIKVDIYGKCGNFSCSKSKEEQCFTMLGKTYKFFLAFENSNCRDYITEKLYKAYEYNMVPVVMGAHPDDYKRLAPPHSYIHVDEFYSPKHLAKFLNDIDKNDAVYSSYFDWKARGYVTKTEKSAWCRLCILLNELDNRPNERQFYKNVDQWWRRKACVPDKWEFVF